MYPVVKLGRDKTRRCGREYARYRVNLPKKVVEAMGDVERLEVRLVSVNDRTAILLVPT